MKPLTIIVVDDDRVCLKTVQRLLRDTGHQVRLCGTQVLARECLTDTSADLVFVDYRMPGNTGVEFLEDMGARLADSRVCLWSSGAVPADSHKKAEQLGAFVLSKSILRDRDTFIDFCEQGAA